MDEKHLHIICYDVPYPPSFGGFIDLFYKIKALSASGVKIHLHCYEYGRGEQPELNKYCVEVHYYIRKEGHKGFSHKLPYIVCSRTNQEMINRLLLDNYPILLEGIHCTHLLNDDRFRSRKLILRLHNAEFEYYRQLYFSERSWFRKLYYWHESLLLRRYEKQIAGKALVLALAEQDVEIYKREFSASQIEFLPAFTSATEVKGKTGHGCYCLYHGNLEVAENERAAIWLIQQVFNDLEYPLVIAGRKPSARLEKITRQHANTCLVADPSDEEMDDIVGKAQVNIVPSFNRTGTKMKLLNSLFNGRHCVADEQTVMQSPLASLCHVCSDADSFKHAISRIYEIPFSQEEIERRKKWLLNEYDNEKNAAKIIQWIW